MREGEKPAPQKNHSAAKLICRANRGGRGAKLSRITRRFIILRNRPAARGELGLRGPPCRTSRSGAAHAPRGARRGRDSNPQTVPKAVRMCRHRLKATLESRFRWQPIDRSRPMGVGEFVTFCHPPPYRAASPDQFSDRPSDQREPDCQASARAGHPAGRRDEIHAEGHEDDVEGAHFWDW